MPSIYDISAQTVSDSDAEIFVRMASNDDPYEKGALVRLDDCGTGVSQVAAILYVAITSPESRIIVIDEPNSFLHPGASKKLLAVLKQFGHQYIVSTHSPEVIRSAAADVLHSVIWSPNGSTVIPLEKNDLEGVRRLLNDLGVRLSDVFGSDQILWVEGPTEELCFPLLLDDSQLKALPSISIVAVAATGDLETSRARVALVWEVYTKLSEGNAIVPPALCFVFDREGRGEREIVDMERQSKGRIKFLARRTFENYLLSSHAISAVLIREGLGEATCAPADIDSWMQVEGIKTAFIAGSFEGKVGDTEWLRQVHAPKLLKNIFEHFSKGTLEFRKTRHSPMLTNWLLKNDTKYLTEIVDFVRGLLPR